MAQNLVSNAAAEEDAAIAALNLFQEFLECPSPLLGKQLAPMLAWALETAGSQQQGVDVRRAAMQVGLSLAPAHSSTGLMPTWL